MDKQMCSKSAQYKCRANYKYICKCIYICMHIYIYIIYLYELCAGVTFSRWFYLIIVTSRNSQPNCEHDPSYQ